MCPRARWICWNKYRIPPDVIGVDHDPDMRRGKALHQIKRLGKRGDHRAVAGIHRVQRLDPQLHAALGRVGDQLLDRVGDHGAGGLDILVGGWAANQHQHIGRQLGRLVDRPAVVVDPRRALSRRGRWEHAARQTPETCRPASRAMRAVAAMPAAASLSRQIPIAGIPARAQPSIASRTSQRWVVAWFRLRRE